MALSKSIRVSHVRCNLQITYCIIIIIIISGIIIIGSLTLILLSDEVNTFTKFNFGISEIMGYLGTILASINVFGGFVVTQRMLAMYKKKKTKS